VQIENDQSTEERKIGRSAGFSFNIRFIRYE